MSDPTKEAFRAGFGDLIEAVDDLHRARDMLGLIELVFDGRTDNFAQSINAGLDAAMSAIDAAKDGIQKTFDHHGVGVTC